MSEPMQTAQTPVVTTEDRTMPAVVYALYLLSFATGITVIAGIIVAYVCRDRAGAKARSHYEFLIRTFWIGLAAAIAFGVLMGIGIVLSIILIGVPIVMVAGLLFCLLGIWFALRCVVGLVYLAREEAYPRPDNWVI